MAARIESAPCGASRAVGRPLEEPVDLWERARGVCDGARFLVLDCLTLWVSNSAPFGMVVVQIEEEAVRVAATAAPHRADLGRVERGRQGVVPAMSSAIRSATFRAG